MAVIGGMLPKLLLVLRIFPLLIPPMPAPPLALLLAASAVRMSIPGVAALLVTPIMLPPAIL